MNPLRNQINAMNTQLSLAVSKSYLIDDKERARDMIERLRYAHQSLSIITSLAPHYIRHYTPEQIAELPTELYRKTALTKIRTLTKKDVILRRGVIQTLEGPRSFVAGDHLAIGVEGEEWPISDETFQRTKALVGRAEGDFSYYSTITTACVADIHEQFTLMNRSQLMLSERHGGHIVYEDNAKKARIVTFTIFAKTYERA